LKTNNDSKPKVVVVVGPTASGKSDLAVKIAKEFNGEIISADSRQVYKGMDIGTAKVPLIKKNNGLYYKNIRHHLIDVIKPNKQFTVRQYKSLGQEVIKDIVKRGKLPIIAGGTGFYIDTLVYNLQIPEIPPQKELRKKLFEKNTEELYEELKKLDPKRAEKINKNNKQRIIRALEIIKTTGKTIPKITKPESPYNPLFIGLKCERDKLKEKIKTRLEKRLKNNNLIQEIKNLHENKISWKRLESFGLEYRYIAQYLQNKISKEEMKEKIVNESYKYAKRQMTWLKRNKEIHWFNQKEKDKALTLVQTFLKN
jgi:tRNA dimethylallyltransferase